MDFQKFKKNWEESGEVCRGAVGRLKYMFWLYGQKVGLLRGREFSMDFVLPDPVGKLRLRVRCNHGADPFVFGEVFRYRYYDIHLEREPETILDLGANIGFASIGFQRSYPGAKLACVEPMGDNVRLLNENLRGNAVAATVFSEAVAIQDGTVTMFLAEQDYGHKVAGIGYGKEMCGRQIDVKAVSVPTLLRALNWDRVGLLKVDIEGYEGVLLRQNCDWLGKVDNMLIECHEGFGIEDLRQIAGRYGFRDPVVLPGVHLLVRDRACETAPARSL